MKIFAFSIVSLNNQVITGSNYAASLVEAANILTDLSYTNINGRHSLYEIFFSVLDSVFPCSFKDQQFAKDKLQAKALHIQYVLYQCELIHCLLQLTLK